MVYYHNCGALCKCFGETISCPWAAAKFDAPPPPPCSLTLQSKTQGIGANREMSLPLLLLPLRIADTDQHAKALLTERWEKGVYLSPPEQPSSAGVWSQGSPAGMTEYSGAGPRLHAGNIP